MALAEHSFSILSHLKNYLRSTINESQLTSMCSIENNYDLREKNQVYVKIFSRDSRRKLDFYFNLFF